MDAGDGEKEQNNERNNSDVNNAVDSNKRKM